MVCFSAQPWLMHMQIHCEMGMNTGVWCQEVYGWHSESIQNYWWLVCISKAQSTQRDCQLSEACQTLSSNWTMSLMINLSHPLAVCVMLLYVFPFMITLLLQTVNGLGENSLNSDQLLTIGVTAPSDSVDSSSLRCKLNCLETKGNALLRLRVPDSEGAHRE